MDQSVSAVSGALSCAASASPETAAVTAAPAAVAWLGPAAWVAFSCALALFMAARGFRKRSLSASGAAAAFVVGSLTMTAGARFGVTLIAFFLSSSKLTRLGAQHKRRVEERFKEGGQRDGVWRGWARGLEERFKEGWVGGVGWQRGGLMQLRAVWDGLDRCWESGGEELQRWERMLLAAFLAHYAACAGDTWSSEIGVLSKRPPRLITTLQVCSLALLSSVYPPSPPPTPSATPQQEASPPHHHATGTLSCSPDHPLIPPPPNLISPPSPFASLFSLPLSPPLSIFTTPFHPLHSPSPPFSTPRLPIATISKCLGARTGECHSWA
ncbi:unnamed protein product [Closterium sp. Yama58-4]|nr:unnamed protein product [Closterium sp. Yama58-4]